LGAGDISNLKSIPPKAFDSLRPGSIISKGKLFQGDAGLLLHEPAACGIDNFGKQGELK
jgi:hypothetical protein